MSDVDENYCNNYDNNTSVRQKDRVENGPESSKPILDSKDPENSSVAKHVFDHDHKIQMNSLKLVNNARQLDFFESIEIYKCRNHMVTLYGLLDTLQK